MFKNLFGSSKSISDSTEKKSRKQCSSTNGLLTVCTNMHMLDIKTKQFSDSIFILSQIRDIIKANEENESITLTIDDEFEKCINGITPYAYLLDLNLSCVYGEGKQVSLSGSTFFEKELHVPQDTSQITIVINNCERALNLVTTLLKAFAQDINDNIKGIYPYSSRLEEIGYSEIEDIRTRLIFMKETVFNTLELSMLYDTLEDALKTTKDDILSIATTEEEKKSLLCSMDKIEIPFTSINTRLVQDMKTDLGLKYDMRGSEPYVHFRINEIEGLINKILPARERLSKMATNAIEPLLQGLV